MNSTDEFISAQPLINHRRNMITTIERFRQIRPKRHQPMIYPLEGRQMLDVPRPASEEPISNFGNATNRSDRSFVLSNSTMRATNPKVCTLFSIFGRFCLFVCLFANVFFGEEKSINGTLWCVLSQHVIFNRNVDRSISHFTIPLHFINSKNRD